MNLPYHNELDTINFENMISKNIHNSYKILWLKSIVSLIEQGNDILYIPDIIKDILINSYDLIMTYHLRFGGTDMIPSTINNLKASNKKEFIKMLTDEKIIEFTKDLTNYVPYRLLRPFYPKLIEIKIDGKVNKAIIEKVSKDPLAFYTFDFDKNSILINKYWKQYILDNISLIKKWIDFKLIMFLQKRNPSIPNIPLKVNPESKRDLSYARKVWQEAIDINPGLNFDIFTKNEFNQINLKQLGKFSIDHFLPWSFVLHDELWNLSPTFQSINSKKSNNLPSERHINDFIKYQYEFFITIKAFVKQDKLIDYISLNPNLVSESHIDCHVFYNTLYDNITSLHKIARINGYSVQDKIFY